MYIISGKKYVSSRLHASYVFPFLPIEGKFLVKRKKNKAVKICGNCNSSMYAQIIIRFNLNLNHANPTNFFFWHKTKKLLYEHEIHESYILLNKPSFK